MLASPSERSALLRYGGGVAILGIATWLRLEFDEALAGGGFMIFFVAVIVASWFGGLGPSLLTLVLSLVVSTRLFESPPEDQPTARALFGLSLFFFTGLTTAMLSESLRAAQRRAEAADRRKDEFLATLAHELRNPLAPISMGLELLRLPGVDSATREWTREVMERQVQHLVRLVDDLLDVSRITRGKVELRKEVVELGSVVAGAVETVQPLINEKQHELVVSLPEEPITLLVDPVRLAQVIGNLLSNAARYTPPGGRIWLSGERSGGMATIRVLDPGIGIAPDMLPRVFELFAQAQTQGGQGGLGIGLTLVRSLVEMSGGTVEARSPGLGKGSEFVVRLPLVAADQAPENRPSQSAQTQLPARRAFVVDDNADAAATLSELLRRDGHEVHTFNDGYSALASAAAIAPDVVLLDIGMPKMDGLETARRLRKMPATAAALLVAVTGWGQEADRRRAQEAGFDHHLVKPVDTDALRELLAKYGPPANVRRCTILSS
ncbi:MAG TPA: ATP-binding protein [Pirellulales bacterium]|nr:ATP-binding protein [Pirellulales bacterium]